MTSEKLFGWAFWAIVSPFILVAGLYLVGATVEHFTAPTADEFYGCTVAQQAPSGECK